MSAGSVTVEQGVGARLAWGLTTLTLLLIAGNLVLRGLAPTARGASEGLLLLPIVLMLACVGGLIASRRPRNPYGWILAGTGLLWVLNGLLVDFASMTMARTGGVNDLLVAAASTAGAVAWGLFVTYGLLLYPTGALPGRRWRVVGWAAGTGLLLMGIGLGWIALDLGGPATLAVLQAGGAAPEEGIPGALNGVGHVLIFASMVAGAVGLFVRMRRADSVERLQLKWFAFGAAIAAVSILVQLSDAVGDFGLYLEIAAFTALPAVIGIAVLRWRLYEIDRIVSRTVTYALLTVLLGAIYLGAVTALTAVTAPVTGDSPVAVAAATLLAAAAFGPARRRIQAGVDRRFNRSRYDAQRTVERFAARMRDQVDLDEVADELHTVSAEALHPTAALLWLNQGGARNP